MGLIPQIEKAKRFSKNGIDIPLPAPTWVYTPGDGPATVVYEVEATTDYAYPTIQLKVPHAELTEPVPTKMASLIRQVTIKGPGFETEPLIIEGPALEDVPIAASALLTKLGVNPNFDSVSTDEGFGAAATQDHPVSVSEAYLAIPAVLKPGKYTFEIQYSGAVPVSGIAHRAFRIQGTARELMNEGMWFACSAKRIQANTQGISTGLGKWSGPFIFVGNPDVGGGIMGNLDTGGTDTNITMMFNGGAYIPPADVIVEGVKAYKRRFGDKISKQVYQHPDPFTDVQISRSTIFDITIVHVKLF